MEKNKEALKEFRPWSSCVYRFPSRLASHPSLIGDSLLRLQIPEADLYAVVGQQRPSPGASREESCSAWCVCPTKWLEFGLLATGHSPTSLTELTLQARPSSKRTGVLRPAGILQPDPQRELKMEQKIKLSSLWFQGAGSKLSPSSEQKPEAGRDPEMSKSGYWVYTQYIYLGHTFTATLKLFLLILPLSQTPH